MLQKYEGMHKSVLGYFDENIEAEKKAKSYNALAHYTKIKVLKKILTSKKIKFTNVAKLADKSEQNSVGGEMYSNYLFSISFTHQLDDNDKMWKFFGDNYKGAKVVFCFYNNIEDLIEKNSLAEGVYGGKVKAKFEFSGKDSNYLRNDNLFKRGILISLYYRDADYSNKEELDFESAFKVKDECWIDLKNLVNIKAKHKYQAETRINAVLSTNKNIEKINYLYVPLNFEKLKEIRIEFGKNCEQKDIEKIENIIKSEHLKNIKLIKAEE